MVLALPAFFPPHVVSWEGCDFWRFLSGNDAVFYNALKETPFATIFQEHRDGIGRVLFCGMRVFFRSWLLRHWQG